MESSTLVSVDDIVEVLPRLGEPLPEAEVWFPVVWRKLVMVTYVRVGRS